MSCSIVYSQDVTIGWRHDMSCVGDLAHSFLLATNVRLWFCGHVVNNRSSMELYISFLTVSEMIHSNCQELHHMLITVVIRDIGWNLLVNLTQTPNSLTADLLHTLESNDSHNATFLHYIFLQFILHLEHTFTMSHESKDFSLEEG